MDEKLQSEVLVIVPVREQTVLFYGDEISGIEVADGEVYVPLKPISDNLGLAWSGQFERLKRDPVITDEVRLIRVTRMKPGPGNPDAVCLPLRLLPGWLFRIQSARVKEELREISSIKNTAMRYFGTLSRPKSSRPHRQLPA